MGLAVLLWAASPSERERRSEMERLQLGDSVPRVLALLGEPAARCPGNSLRHLHTAFPPGWPAASVETAIQELAKETRQRWVYAIGSRRAGGCAPRDGRTEVGVGRDGTVLWYVTVTGKTALRLPERFTPADPTGGPP